MRASPAAQLVGIIRIICNRQNLLQNNLHALGPPETQRRRYRPVRGSVWVGGTHCVMRSRVPSPSSIRPLMHDAHSSRALRLKHRRPAQSRLSPQQPLHAFCPRLRSDNIRRQPNTLWPPTSAAAPVHPNSHASMLANPTSVDTATETPRALRAHGLLPVLVRELTEPTPCGPDGDEGDGCDADLEEKLIRCVSRSNYVCI